MMKHRIFCRSLSLLLILVSVLTLASPVLAYNNASQWALSSLDEANMLGLLPESMQAADMKASITRQEMCYIATLAYENLTGNTPHPNNTDYFFDTDDELICAAYEIGIVGGYPDGTFRPDKLLTRQEFFVILTNLNRCIGMPVNLTVDYLKNFPDRGDVADWAEAAAQEMVGLGVVNGTEVLLNGKKQTILAPLEDTSRQEAITMFLRDFKNADEFQRSDWYTQEELDAMKEAAKEEAATEEAAALIEYALGFVGCSYVFGATGPNSFDCSGFTQYVYKHFGYSIHRIADDQVRNGVAVEFDDLQPGDLLCFANTYASSDWITHVGIYIGDGKMVHAANTRRGITVDSITSGYYYNHYAAARRILN